MRRAPRCLPRRSAIASAALLALLALVGIGCATSGPVNPSLPISCDGAGVAIEAMAAAPRALERPVIVVGGFLDPGLGSWWVGRRLRRVVSDPDRVIGVSFFTCCDFENCRERLIAAVDEAFPSADPEWTTEVDVVGVSMGGVVARDAAAARPNGVRARRLRIARLFTLSSPHRGATLAGIPSFHPLQVDLRYGSDFLRRLDAESRVARYEVFPYVRLDDRIVGPENAAPFGQDPWWLSNDLFSAAHVAGCIDPRAHADIARRLRGEAPIATSPAAPLPGR